MTPKRPGFGGVEVYVQIPGKRVQDLSLLSADELAGRIALLTTEIDRLHTEMTRKRASRDAANSIFKS